MRVLMLVVAGALFLPAPALLHAAGGGGGDGSEDTDFRDPRHKEAAALIARAQFAQAEPLLRELVRDKPDSADGFNLLGFVTRQQGRLREALGHYREALRLKPGHRGAHEYIGEAYLLLGDLTQAKVHLAFLDGDCWLPCAEFSDLKEAVARYEQTRRP